MANIPAVPCGCTLVVGGSPAGVPHSLLGYLVGHADLIIAADKGAEALLEVGAYPDRLVGDLDSISERALDLCRAHGVELDTVPVRKDFSDLVLAFQAVRDASAGVPALRDTRFTTLVCGVCGGRLDHTLATMGELAHACDLRPVVFDSDDRIATVDPTYRPRVLLRELGLSEGDTFSVFGCTPGTVVTERGVSYPVESVQLPLMTSLGLSNVMTEEDARISCEKGVALTVVSEQKWFERLVSHS